MHHKLNIGIGKLVAPAVRILPAAPPHTYFGIAVSMLPGVRTLAAEPPLAPVALCFLAAHVLECTLKAYLSRGGSDKALKAPKIRHDLATLWVMAHAANLNVPAAPPEWVKNLSHLHNTPYYLRYSEGIHGLSMPAPQPMADELEDLVLTVGRCLK